MSSNRFYLVLMSLLLCLFLFVGSGCTAIGQQSSFVELKQQVSVPWKPGFYRKSGSSRVIIFVNGFTGDGIGTWTNKNKAYWPQLIANDHYFNSADIYVHDFSTPLTSQAQTIEELASRMGSFLRTDGVLEYKELIFICHSMGGLITRAFLLKERLSPKQVRLLHFFGTPGDGAEIASIGTLLSRNPQIHDMKILGAGGYVGQLAIRWLETWRDQSLNYQAKLPSYCSYEVKDTHGIKIVPFGSAIALCNRSPFPVNANHSEMVKPEDSDAEPFRYFKDSYNDVFARSTLSEFFRSDAPNRSDRWEGARSVTAAATSAPTTQRGARTRCLIPSVCPLSPFDGITMRRPDIDQGVVSFKLPKEAFKVECGKSTTGSTQFDLEMADGRRVQDVIIEAVPSPVFLEQNFTVEWLFGGRVSIRHTLRATGGDQCDGVVGADVSIKYLYEKKEKSLFDIFR